MNWILIIFMTSPGGDFLGKETVQFPTQKACESVRVQLPVLDSPLGIKHKGLCVTMDHWTGKKKMKDVPLD